MTLINSHKDLVVWQKAMTLVAEVYNVTDNFPKEEVFGITSQMRRSAVSIPSNIAEGHSRGTRKDYLNFLRIAYGSAAELETQIEISQMLSKTKKHDFEKIKSLLLEVRKMLNVMISKLSVPNP